MDPLQLINLNNDKNLSRFKEITKDEIRRIVSNFKQKKGSCDGLTLGLLKNILPHIEDKLVTFINLSLKTGIIPKSWKKSYVIPIPKIPNPKEPKRPQTYKYGPSL
jgi:hypothetical protein